MPGQSKIEQVPNEILHRVLCELPTRDLKSFRLLSSTLTHLPLEHIFNHVRVFIHTDSTNVVKAIADHGQIREVVRSLSFDLRMVQSYSDASRMRRWLDFCTKVGRRSCPGFLRKAAHASHSECVQDVNCPLAAATFGFMTLGPSFQRLPNIRHLELTGGSGHVSILPTAEDFNDFKNIWPRIGTAPSWRRNPSPERQIDKVLTAVLGNRQSLASLSLVGIDWDFVRSIPHEQLAEWRSQIKSLRHLKFRMRLSHTAPRSLTMMHQHELIVDEYAQFICSPTALETLDFAFVVEANEGEHGMPWTWYDYEAHQFTAILGRPSFMHHIRELRFAEMVFCPNDFITLLSRNPARTLRKLHFHKIHLSRGSWLIFLRQLAHAADLKDFSLSGWISSEHEGWNALTQEQAAEYYSSHKQKLYFHQCDPYSSNPNSLVTCEAFEWRNNFKVFPLLPEKWCVRAQIEDWVTSGGGSRRPLTTTIDAPSDPSQWAGWSSILDDPTILASSKAAWHEDSFPLLQGYLPPCSIHHAPSPERQKQYRYEARWRMGLDRDFTFVWAEDLLAPPMARVPNDRERGWWPCPRAVEDRDEICPDVVWEDGFVVPAELVVEDMKWEYVTDQWGRVTRRRKEEILVVLR